MERRDEVTFNPGPAAVLRVSVLMPVYNSEQYLTAALASVRAQKFDNFELIVVDDGSTDGSADILARHAAHEPRMRLITRSNRGLIATRNELLELASGELIAWMDSDDVSHPERLERQVAAFDSNPELVCLGTNTLLIDPEGNSLGLETFPQDHESITASQLTGGGMRFPSTMQRRMIACSVGGFREPFRLGEDLDYLLRVGERGRLGNLPCTLYFYRQHLNSTCAGLGSQWPSYLDIILSLARERREGLNDRLSRGEQIEVPRIKKEEVTRHNSQMLLGWANDANASGHRVRALRYTLDALIVSPTSQATWRSLLKQIVLGRV